MKLIIIKNMLGYNGIYSGLKRIKDRLLEIALFDIIYEINSSALKLKNNYKKSRYDPNSHKWYQPTYYFSFNRNLFQISIRK